MFYGFAGVLLDFLVFRCVLLSFPERLEESKDFVLFPKRYLERLF